MTRTTLIPPTSPGGPSVAIAAFGAALVVLAGCSDVAPASVVASAPDVTAPSDSTNSGSDFTRIDGQSGDLPGAGADVSGEDTEAPCPGCAQSPCEGNAECQSGYCITGPQGKECAEQCVDECPAGYSCDDVSLGTDTVFLCVYKSLDYCLPCRSPQDCANPLVGASETKCISQGVAVGSYCAPPCEQDADCPEGAKCAAAGTALPGSGDTPASDLGTYCQPISGQCACSPLAISSGASTDCASTNGYGTCGGTRSCLEAGLTPCNAAAPVAESCNGKDDNCDGKTDEGIPGAGDPCDGEDADQCPDGTRICTPGGDALTCNDDSLSSSETCNGVDDDCDGDTDGVDAGLPPVPCELTGGACAGAMKPAGLCAGGAWGVCGAEIYAALDAGYQAAIESACDGIDNDCDGQTDEDFTATMPDGTVISGAGSACGAGACTGGTTACSPGAPGGLVCSTSVNAGVESCNGKDDNCDGKTDADDGALVLVNCELGDGVCAGAMKTAALCKDGAWAVCAGAEYAGNTAGKAAEYEPGTELTCDGKDNDCDGASDEDFSVVTASGTIVTGAGSACGAGACAGGTSSCSDDAQGIVCLSEQNSSAEVCDGEDNDCDGATDASDPSLVAAPCDNASGACGGAKKPATLCVGGVWGTCTNGVYADQDPTFQAGSELACDAVDNDCDGSTDEDFEVTQIDGTSVKGAGKPCGSGACASSQTVCGPDAASILCSAEAGAAPETCDSIDDDCDGQTDASDSSLLVTECENQTGECLGAMHPQDLCIDGVFANCDTSAYLIRSPHYEEGSEETCDGKDNDCDGGTDEDFSVTSPAGVAVSGIGKSCGEGACSGGVTLCSTGKDGIACSTAGQATAEICNGKDDDCDGLTDAEDPDMAVTLCGKQAGVCAGVPRPAELCVAGSFHACADSVYSAWSTSYEAGSESSCDGLDNDCDAGIDEDFSVTSADGTVASGPGKTCGTGACDGGVTTCAPSGAAIICTTAAKADAEVCNGKDDDCDGETDSADPTLTKVACEKQAGVCSGTMKLASMCSGGVWAPCTTTLYKTHASTYQAGAEQTCDALDNDCDDATDEDFSAALLDGSLVAGVGALCGTGQCSGGVTECSADGFGVVCNSEGLSTAEVCDGDDDDCDGKTDAADPGLQLVSCDLQAGVCAGAKKPKYLCVDATWKPCDTVQYGGTWEKSKELSCDGQDNDCDGSTDEDFTTLTPAGDSLAGVGAACGSGACAAGVTQCNVAGSGVVCSTANKATVESCNGADDDCDGKTDTTDSSLVIPPCEKQAGVCAGSNKPLTLCAAGSWAACGKPAYLGWNSAYAQGAEATCDGVDDDCDGGTDEDFSVTQADGTVITGAGKSCGTGACAGGIALCTTAKTGISCSTALVASQEVCDGIDDDCDGLTDGQDTDLTVPSCEKQAGVCSGSKKPVGLCGGAAGWQACGTVQYLAAAATYQAGTESSCDGKDNNCDGVTDEDFAVTLLDGSVVTGAGKTCGAGLCSGGATVCNPGKTGIVCASESNVTGEICDGKDNDCDGKTDSADSGLALVACEKTVGVCKGSSKPASLCVAGVWNACPDSLYGSLSGGSYTAVKEVACDAKDNDCDGNTDEDFSATLLNGTMVTGVGTSCGAGKCAGGTTACLANGLGITCSSETGAIAEVCNNIDDDCDGSTDVADATLTLVACELQAGVCAATKKPKNLCVDGLWQVCDTPQYPATWQKGVELKCDGLDNDCDGTKDEDFTMTTADGLAHTGVGASCGAGLCASGSTLCNAVGTGTLCSTTTNAIAEVCNATDDDCDGQTDAADSSLVKPSCEKQTGICVGLSKPAALCAGGTWTACTTATYTAWNASYQAVKETLCDGVNEDCDAKTDEDFTLTQSDGSVVTGAGSACGVGACANGTTACNAAKTGIACGSSGSAQAELCDGIDNDCDSKTDAADPDLVIPNCEKQSGVCAGSKKATTLCGGTTGWQACVTAQYTANNTGYQAATELACDALDNDCDGSTDEDFAVMLLDGTTVTGAGKTCGAGVCSGGATVCTAAKTGILCASETNAVTETCDGKDNDCDGKLDGADPTLTLVACEKATGVCTGAMKSAALCGGASGWQVCPTSVYTTVSGGAYSAGAETACDAKDNDCDAATDEDFSVTLLDGSTVVTGIGKTCGFGVCTGGVTACNAAKTGVVCPTEATNVTAEICDGKDNNCNNQVDAADNALTLVACELTAGVCAGSQKPKYLCSSSAWLPCDAIQYGTSWQKNVETSCDGLDNDCNGTKDEDFSMTTPDGVPHAGVGAACGVGLCANGLTQCNPGGTGTICSTGNKAVTEICNASDDDCDGTTDAADATLAKPSCENQAGICLGSTKTAALCVGGVWGACVTATYQAWAATYQPVKETSCDGVDEDCSGTKDEDFTLVQPDNVTASGVGAACGTGVCASGTTLCLASKAGIQCSTGGSASAEVCDGIDNDCDGKIDAADTDLVIPSCEKQAGVCAGSKKPKPLCAGASGWQACGTANYVAQNAAYQAATELACDVKDNDCDGSTDEDFSVTLADTSVVTGAGKACGVGVCTGGVTACNVAQTGIICPTEVNVVAETCDNKDNDCDGKLDALDPTLVLVPCEKTTGVCTGATKTAGLCVGGAWQACPASLYGAVSAGTYSAGVETACDAKDNDCDASTDEDFPLTLLNGTTVTGIGKSCGVGVCALGTTTCNAAKTGITCPTETLAVTEICDNKDNDCDGSSDAADATLSLPNCESQAGVCAGSKKQSVLCVSGAWQSCGAAQYLATSAQYQATETKCDNLDNNCDGTGDNIAVADLPLNTNQLGACASSRQKCTAGVLSANYPATYNLYEEPDALYLDENCDGIDGTVAGQVFVAKGGNDLNSCTKASPCFTISRGLDVAVSGGGTDVYVQASASAYSESLVLRTNKRIYGGYNTSWVRASYATSGYAVIVQGGLVGSQSITASATSVTGAKLENLVLRGSNASGADLSRGRSSYVVYSSNASISVVRCSLTQGNGAAGPAGANGTDANQAQAATGSAGTGGAQYNDTCDISSRGYGGAGGANSGCSGTSGGAGGNGGTMDTSCNFAGICSNCDATNGSFGATGLTAPLGATGGPGGVGQSSCTAPGTGNAGGHTNGAGGAGGTATVIFSAGYFYVPTGVAGSIGADGGGGGGGGGSGGCDNGTDSYGAGGGGGGAGGCKAASGAGGAGGGGGSSFGVFATGGGTVTVTSCSITRGSGGPGGQGGNGGAGQPGGNGGPGGGSAGGSPAGGTGGKGSHGGHGGGGGGGAGGWSYGIYAATPAAVSDSAVSYSAGAAGAGGFNGGSALNAPVADRDGNPGAVGAAGLLGTRN